jgi:hypothetical protein
LVVIAIIAVLASLLLPALKNARFMAKKAWGMNNLRQVGLAINMYMNDSNGRIPQDLNWAGTPLDLLVPYATSNMLYGTMEKTPCPNLFVKVNPTVPYGMVMCNMNLMGGNIDGGGVDHSKPLSSVKHPTTTFLIAHNYGLATWSYTHFEGIFAGDYDSTWSRPYWGKGTHFYFVDGHLEWVSYMGPGLSKWCEAQWEYDATWFGGVKFYGP